MWFELLRKPVLGVFWLLIVLSACQADKFKDIPDVSDIEIDLNVRRFEQELFKVDTNALEASLDALEKNYPGFGQIFFENILASKDPNVAPEGHYNYIKGFIQHPALQQLLDTCNIVFPDFEKEKAELTQAIQFYKYYFPNQPIPDITTFISEYTVGVFIYNENSLGVGLDFFLGAAYPYGQYNPGNPNFSQYLTKSFSPEYLTSKCMQVLTRDLTGNVKGNRMIDQLIHNGKQLYILDQLIPYAPDSIKMEVSGPQMEWLKENEYNIYAYFVEEDLLYSVDWHKFRKFVEYSPHSPGMPPEAPGRTGDYLGWQIVAQYMDNNPAQTLEGLVEITDAQQILDQARYRPRPK